VEDIYCIWHTADRDRYEIVSELLIAYLIACNYAISLLADAYQKISLHTSTLPFDENDLFRFLSALMF